MPSLPESIRRRVPLLAGWSAQQLTIHALAGLSNQTLRITTPEADYVLRLPGIATAGLVDRQREAHHAALASEAGFAPPLLWQDPARGWLLSAYVADSRPLTAADLHDPSILAGVAQVLRRLHTAELPFQGQMTLAVMDDYLARLTDQAADRAVAYWRLRERIADRLSRLLSVQTEQHPAHVDPHPGNFLRCADGRLYLLDWEYATCADPLWDLADLALEAELDDDGCQRLVTAYGRDDERLLECLADYRGALALVGALWAALQQTGGNDSAALRDLEVRRWDEARRWVYN